MKLAINLWTALIFLASACGDDRPAGAFRGQIEQPGRGPCAAALLLAEPIAGQASGIIEYPTLECWSEVVFMEERDDGELVYRERAVALPQKGQAHSGSAHGSSAISSSRGCPDGRQITIRRTDDSHILARWDDGTYGSLEPFVRPQPIARGAAFKLAQGAVGRVDAECASERKVVLLRHNQSLTDRGLAPQPYGDPSRSFYIPTASNRQNYQKGRQCVRGLERLGLVERSDEVSNLRLNIYDNRRRTKATKFLWRSQASGARLENLVKRRGGRDSFTNQIPVRLVLSTCGGVEVEGIAALRNWVETATGTVDWEFGNPSLGALGECGVQPAVRCHGSRRSKRIPIKGQAQLDFIFKQGRWQIGHFDAPFLCTERSSSSR